MATSPVLFVYYPPLNDDAYPGVPGRHITEADWASFTIAQRRTIENATTQEGYTRRKVWVHRDLVDETEEERAQREAAEAAARAEYDRKNSLVRYGQIEAMIDQLEVLPPAEEFAALRADVDAVADVPPRVEAVEQAVQPLRSGFADQKQLVPDGTALGWFQGPVMVANWAPYKAEGDDDTLVGGRLQDFLSAVSATGIPGVVLPGTYRSDARLDVKSNTRLMLHGVTLRDYNPSLGGGARHEHVPMLRLDNVSNVVIEGGVLDGRKSAHPGTTEFKYGIGVFGGENITIRNVTAIDNKGDGIVLDDWRDGGTVTVTNPKHITIDGFRSFGSHRNGGALAAGEDVTFRDCVFEGAGGASPHSGFDVESMNPIKIVRHVRFQGCTFRGNQGTGLQVVQPLSSDAPDQENILVDGCVAEENGGSGFALSMGQRMTLRESHSTHNGTNGLNIGEGGVDGVRVVGGEFAHNTQYGVQIGTPAYGPNRHITIDGVTVMQNTRGINITAGAAHPHEDIVIKGCRIGDQDNPDTQEWGFRIFAAAGAVVSGLALLDNIFGNATTAKVSIPASIASTSRFRDNVGFVTRNAGRTSVADGGTIAHGLAMTPTKFGVSGSVAGQMVTASNATTTTITVAIKKADGTPGATQNVGWWAEA